MRRVSYQFPNHCDLVFEHDVPFQEAIRSICKLDGSQTNFRTERGLFKREIHVEIARDKTGFERVRTDSDFIDDISERADFLLQINDTLLKGEGRYPAAEYSFLLRVDDLGSRIEGFIVQQGRDGEVDALDLKNLLKGALS
ncbi:hypothetical protein J2T58_000129 [Methanocalculus alkaliphilus]|uniref:hypothetical protein n=1 Tax=Methanocalculus alkaliphilus TaxID=768730 RepID=UPI00209F403B|nr:hypothetical protein [Methanocalculus alkaliphilus]MCP1714302.1 hypothetical protein [Methanocalculus alkaliphilus]